MAGKTYVRERDGVWEVVPEGHRRSHVQADTKEKAMAQARALTRQRGGGEIRVVNHSGKVVASKNVPKRKGGS